MKILLPLLAVPAVAALPPAETRIAFAPAEGLVLTKRYSTTSSLTMDDMSMIVNGNDMSGQAQMDSTTTVESQIVLVDRYLEVDGSRVTKLQRTFDEIEMSAHSEMSVTGMGDMSTDMTSQTDLTGTTVVFTWDPEAEEYDVEFSEDSGGEADLLEGLEMDTDLAEFLPSGAVEEEATWNVPPNAVRDVLVFGGDLKAKLEAEENAFGMGGQKQPTPDQLIGEIEGTVTATFKGTRDEEGVQVAVIQLALDVQSAKDLTEVFQDMSAGEEMPFGEMSFDHVDAEMEFTGEGTLLWNLEGGHAHLLEISGSGKTTMDMGMSASVQGQDMEIEQTIVMTGDESYRIEFVEGSN